MKLAQIFKGGRASSVGWSSTDKKAKKGHNAAQTRKQLLALRPVRNPKLEWFEDQERVVLKIQPPELKSWKTKAINLVFPLPIAPRERHVVLDRIGTDVWHMVDGERTFGQIAATLAEKYQLVPREAEMQLQQYFKEIGRRGYILFLNEDAATAPAASEKQNKKKQ